MQTKYTISIGNKCLYPAAMRRGIDAAARDINAGGDAVQRTMMRMLQGAFSEVEAASRQPAVEVISYIRDPANLEIDRSEKRMVSAAQELVDELSGYVSALGAYVASASRQGVRAAVTAPARGRAKSTTEPLKVQIVSQPSRETSSHIERDQFGNIASTTQFEKDA